MLGQNAILSSLSESDAAALRPHLKTAHLDQKRVLFEAGDTIKSVYFPTTAVISLVVTLSTGETTESAWSGGTGVSVLRRRLTEESHCVAQSFNSVAMP